MNMGVFLTYALLMLSIIALWFRRSFFKARLKLSHLLLLLAAGLGFYFQLLNFYGLAIVLVMVIILGYKDRIPNNAIFIAVTLTVASLFFLHKIPGFNNYKLIPEMVISKNAIPFTMYLNFDKALVGIFILSFYTEFAPGFKEWLKIFKGVMLIGIPTIILTVSLAAAMGYIAFEPKIVSFLPIWMAVNLLFVCVAEEAFFRRLIQGNLAGKMNFKGGALVAILVASIIFGLGHFAGGIKYMLAATVAGIGYGYAYHKTQRIESAILAHFALNLVHICFFTYPALSSAF